MVLAISSIIISLLTCRQVTSVLPVILLRSARASQGKNLSIRIFAFLLLLLVAYNSPTLCRGSRYRSSASYPAFFFTYFAMAHRPLLQGRLRLEVYSFINRLQLFLTSFFRVFFSQFLVSLYRLLSLGLWLFKYFLFAYYWLAIRTAYCTDHAYRVQGPGLKTRQCSFNLFLIAAWIISSLQSISLGVANKPCLFGIRWISSRSQSCYLTILRKLSALSILITYLLLFSCALISKSSYIQMGIQSKVSAHSSLGLHLSSLQYRPSSINVRLIILLADPYCHIIAPGGVASLRPQVSIAFSKHSTCYLAATWIPPHYRQQRFISPNRIDSVPSVLSKLITDIIFSIYGTPLTLGLYTLIIYTSPLYVQIVITTISGLTACYNYKDRLIVLLIIKHTRIAAFGSYMSQNPQGQYINYIQVL